MYLTHSRHDTTYTVGVLSSYMNKATNYHFRAGKIVLIYLAGLVNYGILYKKEETISLKVSWIVIREVIRSIGKSTISTFFHMGSGVVSWISRNQDIITLSTI